jgi:ABC-2 type transport system ATP-binding protein
VLYGRVVHRDGDLVTVRADDPAALNARLVAAGVAVHELTAERRTLEQVVLELTGPSADRVDRAEPSAGANRRSDGIGGPSRADGAEPPGARDGSAASWAPRRGDPGRTDRGER